MLVVIGGLRFDRRDIAMAQSVAPDRLARIVHEADVEDERYDAPEAAGLDSIVRGVGQLFGDPVLLDATLPMYDGLLARLQGADG